ncbi:hypothetical protein OG349_23505 [Streptomyces sp. NBC_01317]|uniref:hypothetical protein n=1 Tax=Streptomyces sp. NBC_01317 TaxID=2903822 RepID=UPI002E12A8FD|nr:hypothetical protein OG349_23505 [Streptomyces sp. NBC_01317]
MRLRHALAPTLGVLAATAVAPALTPPAHATVPDLPATTHAAPPAVAAAAAGAVGSAEPVRATTATGAAGPTGAAAPTGVDTADAVGAAHVARTAGRAGLSDTGDAARTPATLRTAWVAHVVALVRDARDVRASGGAGDGATRRRDGGGRASGIGRGPGVVGAARVVVAAPEADRQPRCGKASDPDFPIDTRIHGGPRSYRPGGGPGTWYLDLTNTTADTCHDIHPVIVLVDRARVLKSSQVRLQMSDGRGPWRTLSLERSDEDETLGILDDGSPGFAVPAGRTVTVRARLTFAKGTRANTIEINSATVQRRGDDGDWVGKSNSYRFSVGRVERGGHLDPDPDLDLGLDIDRDVTVDPPSGQPTDRPDGGRATGRPADSAASPGVGGHREETPGVRQPPGGLSPAPALPDDPELAATGPGGTLGRTLAAGALLAIGGVLFVAFRRLRGRRG